MSVIDKYLELLKKTQQEIQSEGGAASKKTSFDLKQFLEQAGVDTKQFNEKAYQKLLPLMQLAISEERTGGKPGYYAAKLILCLGTFKAAIQYLKKFEENVTRKTNHAFFVRNACIFRLPYQKGWNVKLWQALCRRYLSHDKFTKIFRRAAEIEVLLKKKQEAELTHTTDSTRKPIPIDTLWKFLTSCKYKRVKENLEAAELFVKHGMSEEAFNTFLDFKPEDSEATIPKEFIDGSEIDHDGFYLTKITDARKAILGKLTDCCQHLDHKEGRDCVIYGSTSKLSGFYAICKYKDKGVVSSSDRVVAQTWVWINEKGGFVFDSIEYNIHIKNEPLISDFFMHLAQRLVQKNYTPHVLVGASGRTPKMLLFMKSPHNEVPVRYSGVLDSAEQHYLAHKKLPVGKVYVRIHEGVTKLKSPGEKKEAKDVKEVKELKEGKESNEALEKERALVHQWVVLCFLSSSPKLLPLIFDELSSFPKDVEYLHGLFIQLNQFIRLLQTKKIDFEAVYAALTKNPMLQHLLNTKVSREDVDCLKKTTLLGLACYYDSAATVSALLKLGAKPFSRVEEQRMEPWELAALRKKYDVLLVLLKHDVSFLHLCINKLAEGVSNKKFDYRVVQCFIQAGLSVHQKTNTGRTLLSIAAACGDIELIAYLLRNGAKSSMDAQDDEGKTALHYTYAFKHGKAMYLLIKAGADFDCGDKSHQKPVEFLKQMTAESSLKADFKELLEEPALLDRKQILERLNRGLATDELDNINLQDEAELLAEQSYGNKLLLLSQFSKPEIGVSGQDRNVRYLPVRAKKVY